jgi:hypothetical protein
VYFSGVFVIGVLMIIGAVVMVAAALVLPKEAMPGLIGGALGVGLAGLLLAYLDAPSRKDKPAKGMQKAKARILDAKATTGSVAGYQMVELTLEVQPKGGGLPFQVNRKFSAGRLGRIEAGRELDVYFDPANPKKLDLA